MDNFSAGSSHDAIHDAAAPRHPGDALEIVHADDNLGDEAAFPSTWQQLAGFEAPND